MVKREMHNQSWKGCLIQLTMCWLPDCRDKANPFLPICERHVLL